MSRDCRVLRVFTRGELGGNHLGVISELAELDTDSMQAIAADLGYSETVFIDRSQGLDRGAAIASVRIFTPTAEMPFAGHPLVGTAAVLAAERPDHGHHSFVVTCPVGPVKMRAHPPHFWIQPPFGQPVEPSPLADEPSFQTLNPLGVQQVLMPLPYQVIQLSTPGEVAEMETPRPEWGTLYVWAWVDEELVKARFFAPELGVTEDPATGSGAVAWAAMQVATDQSSGHVTIWQGDEIGHPSTLEIIWDRDRVELGGRVVEEPTFQIPK